MPENITPQPWWVAVVGGVLFTVRWLIGFGASSAKATIESQRQDLDRLNARVDKLEEREEENLQLIEELRAQNAMLRAALGQAGLTLPAHAPADRQQKRPDTSHEP
ncbi:hypothetical protein [Asaia krungthepensis]|uniref:Uncharacterized protein n=1 Tax=Asaia krungthepensis NRIC 0535 TaxID=1307925 RepID=A0ABQ0Q1F9_9PROT|nr:hypothetical protein [Asaia krungthepensis]GBQ86787.1 hypothetical protein AA0535_1108 [Asaia krungthepensis NRIC 0535]